MCMVFLSVALVAGAQSQTDLPALDKSPMDMSYYPAGYPYVVKVKGEPGTLVMRLIYSRPQKRGRTIFGNLEPYGKVDRLGANEANELDIYQPVTIGGKELAPGRYTLYAIFHPDKWTLIVSKETDTWGAYAYDASKDILRTDVPVKNLDKTVEALTMVFEKADNGANLVMAWDNIEA